MGLSRPFGRAFAGGFVAAVLDADEIPGQAREKSEAILTKNTL
jgi:hypothetical protein